jgi:hypothetical protein
MTVRVFKKPMSRGIRLFAALLIAMATIVSISAASQGRALAASCAPGWTGSEVQNGTTLDFPVAVSCSNYPISHVCDDMGSSGGVHAIECEDIYISWNNSSYNIYSVGDYYCQSAVGKVPCAAMNVSQLLWEGAGASLSDQTGVLPKSYSCTASASTCPGDLGQTAPEAQVASPHLTGTTPTNQCIGEIVAGINHAANKITVADGSVETDSSALSTPFYEVCFDWPNNVG